MQWDGYIYKHHTIPQCCCSAPPYPVCCCGPNRYSCCVPFQQGPCGSLCKGMVIALSVLVILVAIASVVTCRVRGLT